VSPSARREHEVIVVGGGVAGMAAAWTMRDRDVLLVEASDHLGGRLKSCARDPYWLNLGGHLFPGVESAVGELINDLGLRTIKIPGSTFGVVWDGKVYSRSRVELYPLTLPMSLRERLAFATTGLRILRAVRAWKRAQGPDQPGSLSGRGRADSFRTVLGRPPGRVAQLFETAARRASTELDDQSAATAGQLFTGVWAGKNSSLALNLAGGSGRLGQAFADRMSGSFALGCEALSVEADDASFVLTLRRADVIERVRTRAVVLATPAAAAARIAEPLPAQVRDCLTAIPYGAFVSMAVLTSETLGSDFDGMYAVTTPGCSFDMLFNHANPLRGESPRRPGGSLMVYAGGERARELLGASDDDIAATFLTDIVRILPHLQGRIAETQVQRWPVGLSYRRPSSELGPLRDYVAGEQRLQLCGDYFGDLGNMEIAAGSGVRAAQRVLAGLAT